MEGARIVEVRAPRRGDPEPLGGLILPGLINAHTHLELSWVGAVPGGAGLVAWVRALMQERTPPADRVIQLDAAREAARGLAAAGTAAVCDIAGALDLAGVIAGEGLSGAAELELIGHDELRRDAGVARAASVARTVREGGALVQVRAAAHAPYSTHPELARAALAPGSVPGSVHLAEDPAELRFLDEGEGAFADLLRFLEVPFDRPTARDPVSWLEAVGALRTDVLAVHGVLLDAPGIRRLAQARTPLCLCVRSNRWIGGRIPDVPALLAAGVRLCLGTDSIASCPDLDVLGEVEALSREFPDVARTIWLGLATRGGADALGLPWLGRLQAGASPGLLHIDAPLEALHQGPRRWLTRPAAPPESP